MNVTNSPCCCTICRGLTDAQAMVAYWTMRRANSHPGYPDPLPRPAARSLVHDMHTWIWDEKSPDQIECLHCGESGRWADPYSRTLILGRTFFCHKRTPMKDTTVVNGVTLTRAQVEGALKDLNAPPTVKNLLPGMIVRSNDRIPIVAVVVDSVTEAVLRKHYGRMIDDHRVVTIGVKDGVCYTLDPAHLEVGSVTIGK